MTTEDDTTDQDTSGQGPKAPQDESGILRIVLTRLNALDARLEMMEASAERRESHLLDALGRMTELTDKALQALALERANAAKIADLEAEIVLLKRAS